MKAKIIDWRPRVSPNQVSFCGNAIFPLSFLIRFMPGLLIIYNDINVKKDSMVTAAVVVHLYLLSIAEFETLCHVLLNTTDWMESEISVGYGHRRQLTQDCTST